MRQRAILLCIGVSLALTGCVRHYRAPSANQPHAILKVRRTYAESKGPMLTEIVDIDGHRMDTRDGFPGERTTTSAVRVHPRAADVEVASEYYRIDRQMVREQYTVYETEYYTDSYSCGGGYGSSSSYRTCSRQATRQKPVTKWRNVWKDVRVVTAACRRRVRIAPVRDHLYLMQYSFHDHGHCNLRCFEQHPRGDGQFDLTPCPPAPAAPD